MLKLPLASQLTRQLIIVAHTELPPFWNLYYLFIRPQTTTDSWSIIVEQIQVRLTDEVLKYVQL